MAHPTITKDEVDELVKRAPRKRPRPSYEDRAKSLRTVAGSFKGGEAKLELVVMIERQHGQVGGLPDQDWPLRVTQIYRRDGSDWLLVHRHADPLVDAIGLEQAAALARG